MRTQDPRVKGLHCPHCGELNDDYDPSDMNRKRRPQHGDLNICVYCLRMSTFEDVDGNLALVVMTQDRQDQLVRDHEEVAHALDLARKRRSKLLLAREIRKRMQHYEH